MSAHRAVRRRHGERHVVEDLDQWRQSRLDGCSVSTRRANECSVPMRGGVEVVEAGSHRARRSRSIRGGRDASLELTRTRSRSSAAAFSVNVIAATPRARGRRAVDVTSSTIRSTSTVVLPVPAPASTNNVSSSRVRTVSCVGEISEAGHEGTGPRISST